MILKNKRFEDIEKYIPKDLYNKLIHRRRVIDEDKKIMENMIWKLCRVNTYDDLVNIMKGIEPLLISMSILQPSVHIYIDSNGRLPR